MEKTCLTTNGHDHQRMIGETDMEVKEKDLVITNNYSSHSQVATGYKDNSYQGSDRRSSGYRSYRKVDYKKFPTRESREYNPSPEDMLNGPCHIHSAFVDGKRVSRHAIKDCTTFLKL
jgi:hypothetical protein